MTIAMIAEEAGVSLPTVSKVLNGHGDVSAETRQRVQGMLTAAGYRRRGRSARKVGLVEFLITELDTPWACELLRGAEREAHRLGTGLVVTVTHDRRSDPREWLKSLAARRSDGVVLVMSRVQEAITERLRPLNTPFVVVDPVGGFDPEVPSIGSTNWAGGFSATEHLVGLGHRRIGMIAGPHDMMCSQERLDGYRAALGRVGIPVDAKLIRHGDFYTDGGYRGALALLDLADPPSAIFAGSDQQARGVYDAARSRGLRLPEDLSVIGFDDVDACEWMFPKLTTIRQPLAEMAALAIRSVLQPHGDAEPPLRVELATSLVVRDSTCPPSSTRAKPKVTRAK
ncbi:LacI family DNA-binding transcriptional regulator [Acidothermaceae bacterium B102]|nr:LacI family DNA-binding transcriptional regulator [Acidothermaceae bacterium B102]